MGNVKVKAGHLMQMLDALVEKSKGELSIKGLELISDEIPEISSAYLYKKIFLAATNKKKTELISLRGSSLHAIAAYLEFRNFKELIQNLTKPRDEQLKSLAGTYYSYVRKNLKQGILYKAPVSINENQEGFTFDLKGVSSHYKGRPYISKGCLFITMESPEGKIFFHVYKVGNSKKPEVLQGVFSGVSTSFDPIAGRAILLRVDEDFEVMKNRIMDGGQMMKSKSASDRKIGKYFKEYLNNNVTIHKAYTFDPDDLDKNPA